jgi:hypothetical protein
LKQDCVIGGHSVSGSEGKLKRCEEINMSRSYDIVLIVKYAREQFNDQLI